MEASGGEATAMSHVLHRHVPSPTSSHEIQMINRRLRSSAEFVLTSRHDSLLLKFKH